MSAAGGAAPAPDDEPDPAPGPARRRDESMALLTGVMEHPLDLGYAAAAERRRSGGQPPVNAGRSVVVLLVLVLVGLLLATAALQARGQTTSRVAERDLLVAEIARQDGAASRLQQANVALANQLEAERTRQLEQQAQGDLADQVTRLGLVTGALSVAGPGITVTVDDAAAVAVAPGGDARASTTADDGRVLDQDLQKVVNGLWAAGAEAVSVNGQRLSALSAIRSAGQAILVDYRPLSPPYRVLAIGDPDTLPARFADGAGGRDLLYLSDNFGVRYDVASSPRLVLPASAGLDVRRAQPVAGVATAQTGPSVGATSTATTGPATPKERP